MPAGFDAGRHRRGASGNAVGNKRGKGGVGLFPPGELITSGFRPTAFFLPHPLSDCSSGFILRELSLPTPVYDPAGIGGTVGLSPAREPIWA